MAKISDQVCLNHVDRQAVSRCATCFRPLCEGCVIDHADGHFCSQLCMDNYAESDERMQKFEASARRDRRRKRIRRLVALIIVAAVVAAVYSWTSSHPEQTRGLIRRLQQTIGLGK